jgi:hypothetical protein
VNIQLHAADLRDFHADTYLMRAERQSMAKDQTKQNHEVKLPVIRIGFMEVREVRRYYAITIDGALIEKAREWFGAEHPIETESDLLQLDETILFEFLAECSDSSDPEKVEFVEEELLPLSASGNESIWFTKWDADGRRTVIDFEENY